MTAKRPKGLGQQVSRTNIAQGRRTPSRKPPAVASGLGTVRQLTGVSSDVFAYIGKWMGSIYGSRAPAVGVFLSFLSVSLTRGARYPCPVRPLIKEACAALRITGTNRAVVKTQWDVASCTNGHLFAGCQAAILICPLGGIAKIDCTVAAGPRWMLVPCTPAWSARSRIDECHGWGAVGLEKAGFGDLFCCVFNVVLYELGVGFWPITSVPHMQDCEVSVAVTETFSQG